MPGRKMELFNLWLPMIGGGILFAIAIGAWFAEQKIHAIWFGFSGLVCLLLLFALQLQEYELSFHTEKTIPEADKLARRAVLNVVDWQFENIGPNLSPHIRYLIKNTGPTPATILDDGSQLRYGRDLIGAPAIKSHPSYTMVPGEGFITANLENPPALPIPPEYYGWMVIREQFIFVYGRLIYRDIFGDKWELGFLTRIEAVPGTPSDHPVFRNSFPNEPKYSYLRRYINNERK